MKGGIFYCGHPVRLRCERDRGSLQLKQDSRHRYTLFIPEGVDAAQAGAFLRAYERQENGNAWRKTTEQEMVKLCASWSERIGIRQPQLTWAENPAYWGQADWQKGMIRLNRILLKAPGECAEAVLVHELCHWIHHGHTPGFWQLMSELLPDWTAREGKLRGIRFPEKSNDI